MKIQLSEKFEENYGKTDWQCVTIGQSNAEVYQCEQFVLKKQMKRERETLFNEKLKLEWLNGKVSVPDVIDYDRGDMWEYLLLSRLSGVDAAQTKGKNNPEMLVSELGRALRHLHQCIPIDNCPFDMRLQQKFDEASSQLKTNEMIELTRLNELILMVPDEEDLVLTHGDYCLPNVIIDDKQCSVVGFVDVGRAGIADRYCDVALALRSIHFNLGEGYQDLFLHAYGIQSNVNEMKITFYQRLDDLF